MSFFVIFNPIFHRLAVSLAYLQSFTAKHSTSCYTVYGIKVKTIRVSTDMFFRHFQKWGGGTIFSDFLDNVLLRMGQLIKDSVPIIKIGSKTEMGELLRLHYLLPLLYVSQVHKLRLYFFFISSNLLSAMSN